MAAFSDEELTTFCYDNFRPVYEEFATGMSRTQKVQRLVEYCERRGEMEKLLAQVEQANPYQYDRFRRPAAQLIRIQTEATCPQRPILRPRRTTPLRCAAC